MIPACTTSSNRFANLWPPGVDRKEPYNSASAGVPCATIRTYVSPGGIQLRPGRSAPKARTTSRSTVKRVIRQFCLTAGKGQRRNQKRTLLRERPGRSLSVSHYRANRRLVEFVSPARTLIKAPCLRTSSKRSGHAGVGPADGPPRSNRPDGANSPHSGRSNHIACCARIPASAPTGRRRSTPTVPSPTRRRSYTPKLTMSESASRARFPFHPIGPRPGSTRTPTVARVDRAGRRLGRRTPNANYLRHPATPPPCAHKYHQYLLDTGIRRTGGGLGASGFPGGRLHRSSRIVSPRPAQDFAGRRVGIRRFPAGRRMSESGLSQARIQGASNLPSASASKPRIPFPCDHGQSAPWE